MQHDLWTAEQIYHAMELDCKILKLLVCPIKDFSENVCLLFHALDQKGLFANDPPFTERHVRFTKEPFKSIVMNNEKIIVFAYVKFLNSNNCSFIYL